MGIQSLIRWLIPREDRFYSLLERQAEINHLAASALKRVKHEDETAQQILDEVLELEHQGDKLMHELESGLAQTFVTPIDREDIHQLSSKLDDIVDTIKSASQAYVLYGIEKPTPALIQLMEILERATLGIREIMPSLTKHAYTRIIEANREIFKLEKEADLIFRKAVSDLFHDPNVDARELLRTKEVLEDLEKAINSCESVVDLLSTLAVKHG